MAQNKGQFLEYCVTRQSARDGIDHLQPNSPGDEWVLVNGTITATGKTAIFWWRRWTRPAVRKGIDDGRLF